MNRTVDILSKNSIDKLTDYLTKYKDNLEKKCEEFCTILAKKGYTVARATVAATGPYGTHKMEDYIVFMVETTTTGNGAESTLIGLGTPFTSIWKSGGEIHQAEIHPLEMVEFGTGVYAVSPSVVYSRYGKYGGQGTLEIAGHQNENRWGANNAWTAINPTSPMYYAYMTMYEDMGKVAKKVFGVK